MRDGATETLSLTSFHSWKARSLNSPQTPLWLLASGTKESRAKNRVFLYGWPKDPQNPPYAQLNGESREALGTLRLHGSRAPVLPALCDPAAVTLLLEMGTLPRNCPSPPGPTAPFPPFLRRGRAAPFSSTQCIGTAAVQPAVCSKATHRLQHIREQAVHEDTSPWAPAECLRHQPHLVATSGGDAGILSLVLQL